MKMRLHITLATLLTTFLISCGSKEEKKEGFSYERKTEPKEQEAPPKTTITGATVDLTNKGIGPVKSVTISETINQSMASQGEELFKSLCAACHKPTKKFIGPAPINILERRSPEWVMNMIMNPEQMIKEDPIAIQLLKEANGAPMANQNVSEEQARAILEYFRTIK